MEQIYCPKYDLLEAVTIKLFKTQFNPNLGGFFWGSL